MFKPKQAAKTESDNVDRKPFVAIVPEEGLTPVQIGLIVNLGLHKKMPKFAKDNAGKREQDEEGNDKIIYPKEGKDLEQKVAVYADLLSQTHDYGDEIGVKNIRLPLHQVSRGMSEGLNFTTVAPRDPEGNYIKGRPWLLAPASAWCKIAKVVKMPDGTKVDELMLKAEYKNPYLNDISLLLGKAFMYDVEVKVSEKGDNKYVNTKLKSPVPLMKGMQVEEALIPAISINFEDTDLLEVKEELGGIAKFDLLRLSDLRKIVLATDYPGSEMQKAVQARQDESDLISKAKEIAAKIIESDKELQEILAMGEGDESATEEAPVKKEPPKPAAKATKPVVKKAEKPVVGDDDDDSDQAPF